MLVLLPVSGKAAEAEEQLGEALGVDALEDTARDLELPLPGEGAEEPGSFLPRLVREALQAVLTKELLREMGCVMLVSVVCAAFSVVGKAESSGFDALSLGGAAAITLLLSGSQHALTVQTEQAVGKLQDVANVLLPILSSAALLSGQVTAAAAKYAAAALFFNVLVNLCCRFVLPVVRLYIAAALGEAVVGSGVLSGVLGFLRWCAVTALSVLMLAFTLYLSLTSLTANAADASVVRSAKTAMATLLPVVGSIAGDAASSLLSAAGVIRQSVGVFGLMAVSAVLLGPFLAAGARGLLLKGVAAIAEGLSGGRLPRLLKRLSEAVTLLMGCLGACGLLLFFSVYALIGTVVI